MTPRYGQMQARLQARHGARIDPAQWHRLTGAGSFTQFLSRARETPLASWLEGVDSAGDLHHLEGVLREAFRHHVARTASWAPQPWQPAILWVRTLPDLAVGLHQQKQGNSYDWMNALDGLELLEWPADGSDPLTWWLTRWQELWPAGTRARAQLTELIHLLRSNLTRLATLNDTQAANALWYQVQESLELRFRRYAMQPAALFVHLLLTSMDLERLRGELSRRWVFAAMESGS